VAHRSGPHLGREKLLELWINEMDEEGKVNDRGFCISGFSHRWERPSLDPAKAHPDSLDHKKARLLAEYGSRGTCPIFEPHHQFDYYYWLDFAGINQFDLREKQLGVCKLPAFISATVEIIMFNSSTVDYEPRAWTRMERALGFTFTASPLFVYMDDNYPNEPLDLNGIISSNPGCFMKDPDSGALMLRLRDPCGDGACVTDKRDLALLEELKTIVQTALPLNPQRLAAGTPELSFDKSCILLDTEHYNIDCTANLARMTSQRSSVTKSSNHSTPSAIGATKTCSSQASMEIGKSAENGKGDGGEVVDSGATHAEHQQTCENRPQRIKMSL